MEQDFDEQGYARRLVKLGSDPDQAAEVARRMAETKSKPAAKQVMVSEAEPKGKPKQPKERPLSVQETKLVEASADIYGNLPTGNDMAFSHAVFCQVGLPRSQVDGREFLRQSGAAWVNIQAGYLDEGDGPVQQPIPYGALPRLALAHVSTYAVRFKTREIPVGDSASQFLELMGMDHDGRRYANLRKQMHALAACRLQMGYKGRTFNGQAVEQFDAWLANKGTNQRPLWPGVMTLSEHFYNSLIDAAVPLDKRALHALKGSALALDVYSWLAHRLHRIEGLGVTLRWASLREQFAQEYTGKDADKNFKDAFITQLRKVLAEYPQARVKQVRGGLLLLGSPPPIPYKAN